MTWTDAPGVDHSTPTAADRTAVAQALRRGGGAALHEAVLDALVRAAEEPVLVSGGRLHTGRALAERIENVTARLYDEGVRERDVVLMAVRPGADFLALLLALLRIGAVAAPIARGAGPELFRRRVELLSPSWVFGESLVYAASAPVLRRILRRRGLEIPDIRRVPARHVVVGRMAWGAPSEALRWSDFCAEKGRTPIRDIPVPDAGAPAMIVFTSGTTEAPKGVQHSGASAAGAISLILENLDALPASVFSNQSVHSTVATILAGARTIIAPLRFRPGGWLRSVARHGVTHASLRPWDAYRLTEHCRRRGRRLPEGLRHLYLYSAPITPNLLRRLHRLGHSDLRCTSLYGMTEALPVSSIGSRERLSWPGSGDLVGRPVDGVDVRVGDAGTLQVRGPNVHLGYLGMDPVEWHDTGDLARIEADASIVLLGRAKNMILRDSFNIYPGLYEETIEGITGVAECAMVGVAHAESADERVVLFVSPDARTSARERRELSARANRELRSGSNRIDHEALPDVIMVLDHLPRNRSGKIDRPALRDLAGSVSPHG